MLVTLKGQRVNRISENVYWFTLRISSVFCALIISDIFQGKTEKFELLHKY